MDNVIFHCDDGNRWFLCYWKVETRGTTGRRHRRYFLRLTIEHSRAITVRLNATALEEYANLATQEEKIDWCTKKTAQAGHTHEFTPSRKATKS